MATTFGPVTSASTYAAVPPTDGVRQRPQATHVDPAAPVPPPAAAGQAHQPPRRDVIDETVTSWLADDVIRRADVSEADDDVVQQQDGDALCMKRLDRR